MFCSIRMFDHILLSPSVFEPLVYPAIRLSALVELQIQPLKGIFLSGHRYFPVQYRFPRTRQPLYFTLQTNYLVWDPHVILFLLSFLSLSLPSTHLPQRRSGGRRALLLPQLLRRRRGAGPGALALERRRALLLPRLLRRRKCPGEIRRSGGAKYDGGRIRRCGGGAGPADAPKSSTAAFGGARSRARLPPHAGPPLPHLRRCAPPLHLPRAWRRQRAWAAGVPDLGRAPRRDRCRRVPCRPPLLCPLRREDVPAPSPSPAPALSPVGTRGGPCSPSVTVPSPALRRCPCYKPLVTASSSTALSPPSG
jgi:hypothetical protein